MSIQIVNRFRQRFDNKAGINPADKLNGRIGLIYGVTVSACAIDGFVHVLFASLFEDKASSSRDSFSATMPRNRNFSFMTGSFRLWLRTVFYANTA